MNNQINIKYTVQSIILFSFYYNFHKFKKFNLKKKDLNNQKKEFDVFIIIIYYEIL